MRANLVKIGNSQGIRLPKAIIEQAGLTEELDLQVSGQSLIIRPLKQPRDSWGKAAAECHQAGEDQFEIWDSTSGDFPDDDTTTTETVS